jgi:hypothetical protein
MKIKNSFGTSIYIIISLFHFLIQHIYTDIIVRSPSSLRAKFKNGSIKTSYALFGYNPYGYTLTGRVFYDPDNTEVDLACDAEKLKGLVTEKSNRVDHAAIVMVDRGNCKFTNKARNIQNAGGKVALIVNYVEGDPTSVIMRDDGTGSDIMIPLVLISKEDGEILKDYYKTNKNNPDALRKLVLDVDFQIEHSRNTAKVEVFMNSDSIEIYKLVQELSKYEELRK